MNARLIETIGLKKHFSTPRGSLHAVDGISLTVDRGRTLGIVGESGCGKSTLGRVVLRLLDATDGKMLYDGLDIMSIPAAKMDVMRRKMQIIFQDPYASLNPRMTVSEIIAEPIKVLGTAAERSRIDDTVNRLMSTVGLAERFVNAYPHELDGGRRQRIGIARALSLDPEFIVCDEPVSALDVSIQAQILNLLMDLQDQRGLTYMFVTHNLSVVKHISDEIMVMYLGLCVERATSDELFENPLHPYTQALLSAIPVPNLRLARSAKHVAIRGEVSSPIDPKPGCRFANRCPHASAACTGEDIPLREVTEGHFAACVLCK
jgi:peptide/nickel transport system ATP-binding protein